MAATNIPFKHSSIDLLIFDCDGVLIDSEILSKRVLLIMLEELGVSVSDDYFDQYFLGQNYLSVKEQILIDYSVALSDGFRQDYLDALLQVFAQELTATSGIETMLLQLNSPCCVATSSSPERVKFALATTKLNSYFSNRVFTCSEVENGKPAPDIFLHSASKMGVAPENCLVIEDSQAGIQGALAANMNVIKYAGASHLKSKGISPIDIANKVHTIFDWEQLFDLFPSLKASSNIRGKRG